MRTWAHTQTSHYDPTVSPLPLLYCIASRLPSGSWYFCFAVSLSVSAPVVWELLRSKIKNELYLLIRDSSEGIKIPH